MPTPKRKVRVKNATRIIIDEHLFNSKAEAYYYTLLKERLLKREIQAIKIQQPYELQPQFKKCTNHKCNFFFEKPESGDLKRYKILRVCPKCGHALELHREMVYVSDFDVVDNEGYTTIIDVKSSKFFQTEIFKLKRKIFEYRFPDKNLIMVFPTVPKKWNPEESVELGGIPSSTRECVCET